MSLQPRPDFVIPEKTRRVAHAAFPKGTLGLRIADEIVLTFRDDQFAALFPTRGQPAASPARLALASILQYVEGLSDRRCYSHPGHPEEDSKETAKIVAPLRLRVASSNTSHGQAQPALAGGG